MPTPNLLVITLHDTGRHFGCYGVDTVHSPHIDRLATEGVRCTRMFCASPVCSPSRGAMNTGRYPQSNGLMGLVHEPWRWRLDPEERHIAQLLGAAGYQTAVARFQHEAPEAARLGFEHELAMGPLSGCAAAEQVAEWLTTRDDPRPFYLQFGLFETHTPYDSAGTAPDDSRGVTIPEWVADTPSARAYFAGLQGSVRHADQAVGTVLAALDTAGLTQDTVVVFTVDHGVEIGGLRAKWSCYDPGLEIAYLVRWPGGGIDGGRTLEWLLGNVDHTPTMLDLLGIDPPANLEGRSFAAGLRGTAEATATRDAVFAMFLGRGDPRAIRTDRYKLIRNFTPGRWPVLPVDIDRPAATRWATRPAVELYDLETDPQELTDVAEDPAYAEIRAHLDRELVAHLRRVGDGILEGPIQTPYHRDAIASLP